MKILDPNIETFQPRGLVIAYQHKLVREEDYHLINLSENLLHLLALIAIISASQHLQGTLMNNNCSKMKEKVKCRFHLEVLIKLDIE